MRYYAFHVTIVGTIAASYDLQSTEAKEATEEAREYLLNHPTIEVWAEDHRRVARLTRED